MIQISYATSLEELELATGKLREYVVEFGLELEQ